MAIPTRHWGIVWPRWVKSPARASGRAALPRLPALAEQDDVKAVTKRINGGYNGLDDRIHYLTRAKAVLCD